MLKDCSIVSILFSEHSSLSSLLLVEASLESSPVLSNKPIPFHERSLSVIAHLAMHSQEGDQEEA